jgi:hypothetical protein
MWHPYAYIGHYSWLLFDIAGVTAIVGMAVMAIGSALRHTLALYREEALE